MAGADFFQFREEMMAAGRGARSKNPAMPVDAITVSQLTSTIERAIKAGVPASVLVRGEISNFSFHRGSGHLYFTMKDANACVDCVMFKSDAQRLKFEPADGEEMLAGGRIGVYAQRGRYQLYVNTLSPLGKGALELAFQQLRAKLEADGLFAAERKRPLPTYPRRILLLTSRQTAALQDMLKVLRRYPYLQLMLFHVPVQGDGSAELIADALAAVNAAARGARGKGRGASESIPSPLAPRPLPLDIDVIVLARGGGSLEDLWEFNEECVARAIVASRIPIITGIGHEVDVSIADLVADYHAHTPTEAAQVIVASWNTARQAIATGYQRQLRAMRQLVETAKHRLTAVERHEAFRRPMDRVNQLRQLLDDKQRALTFAVSHRLRGATARVARASASLIECHPRHRVELSRQRVTALAHRFAATIAMRQERRMGIVETLDARLRALSPQGVLKRGYSITAIKKGGAIVRSAGQVKAGERLMTRFADGEVESIAQDQKQMPLFE